MARSVNPNSQRLPVKKNWKSDWFSQKDYGKKFQEDRKIRKFVKEELEHGGIGKVKIKRSRGEIKVTIYTSRPGIVIGHKGAGVEKLKKQLAEFSEDKINVDIKEIGKPEIWANVMAQQVAYQIAKRVSYKRAMKRVMEDITRNPAVEGAKIRVSGRLGGLEISRSEYIEEGSLPLQTLRTDIDYGFTLAKTKFGSIGVKVWINRGEMDLSKRKAKSEKEEEDKNKSESVN